MRRLPRVPWLIKCHSGSLYPHPCRCCGRWLRARPDSPGALEWYCMMLSKHCASGETLIERCNRISPWIYYESIVLKKLA